MKIQKIHWLWAVAIATTALILSWGFADYSKRQWKAKHEAAIFPLVHETALKFPVMRITPSFVITTDQSILVVVHANPPNVLSEQREPLRDALLKTIRAWGADHPLGWGKYISVTFADEVTVQGKK